MDRVWVISLDVVSAHRHRHQAGCKGIQRHSLMRSLLVPWSLGDRSSIAGESTWQHQSCRIPHTTASRAHVGDSGRNSPHLSLIFPSTLPSRSISAFHLWLCPASAHQPRQPSTKEASWIGLPGETGTCKAMTRRNLTCAFVSDLPSRPSTLPDCFHPHGCTRMTRDASSLIGGRGQRLP